MSRATEELMDMLHQLTAKTLLDEIKTAVSAKDEDGNPLANELAGLDVDLNEAAGRVLQ